MGKQDPTRGRNWYVIHTISGYEESVCSNLKQRIESLDMEDKIFDVIVPTETKIKISNGKKKTVRERIFPGYVLVNLLVDDDSWYVVRNTPNVTGFIGVGNTPTPISEDEVKDIMRRMGVEEPKYNLDVQVDDIVKVVDGAFKDFEGKIVDIDNVRGKLKILINMFGRETPVELDFLQVQKTS